jgi:hypothetical protein
MTDLFDLAKPVRDATLAEYERVNDADIPEPLQEGYRVGMHLAAVMMVATGRRLGGFSGQVESEHLMHFLAVAISGALSYCATSFRPIAADGRPIPSPNNLVQLTNLVLAYAMQSAQLSDAGAQDFVVPFHVNADGAVTLKQGFDYRDLLKGDVQ